MFKSIDEVKENLASFVQGVPSTIDQVGYIEPGHGVKGKQRWLSVSEDLEDMYTLHQQKHEILLWCYAIRPKQSTSNSKPSTSNSKPSTSKSSKRQHSPDQPSRKKTRYDNHTDKMMEVESIEDELLENHDGNYSREQIRAWAHLIQMGKVMIVPLTSRFGRHQVERRLCQPHHLHHLLFLLVRKYRCKASLLISS